MKNTDKDYSVTFCEMFPQDRSDAIAIYSYGRVSSIFWSALMNELQKNGYSEAAAIEWCRSKAPRLAMDNKLGNMIERMAKQFAKQAHEYASPEQCEKWSKEAA